MHRSWKLVGLALVFAMPASAQGPTGPAIRGVVFVHRWHFDEPAEFWTAGERRSASRGEIVGLAVHPGLFRPHAGLRPTIWVDDTAAIDRGGPFGDADHPFVVVQVPEIDLSTARFWVGPREPADRIGPERVRTLFAEAQARGRLTRPLSPDTVTTARAVLSGAPPRDASALFRTLRDFCRRTDLRRLRTLTFDG